MMKDTCGIESLYTTPSGFKNLATCLSPACYAGLSYFYAFGVHVSGGAADIRKPPAQNSASRACEKQLPAA